MQKIPFSNKKDYRNTSQDYALSITKPSQKKQNQFYLAESLYQ